MSGKIATVILLTGMAGVGGGWMAGHHCGVNGEQGRLMRSPQTTLEASLSGLSKTEGGDLTSLSPLVQKGEQAFSPDDVKKLEDIASQYASSANTMSAMSKSILKATQAYKEKKLKDWE